MQSVAVIERHLLLWRDPPVWPFVWRGLLPLAALAGGRPLRARPLRPRRHPGRGGAGTARAAGRRRLRLGRRAVSGQSVNLTGVEPHAATARAPWRWRAPQAVPTWLGRRICAVRCRAEFSPPAASAAGGTRRRGRRRLPRARRPLVPAPLAARPASARLANSLAAEQIKFAPGSAKIDARSGALLDQLAREVRSCPGTIRIEGYTDTVGRGRVNEHLSEATCRGGARGADRARRPPERLRRQGLWRAARRSPTTRPRRARAEPAHRIPHGPCQLTARGFHGLSPGKDTVPPGGGRRQRRLLAYWWFRRHYEDVTLEYTRSRAEWDGLAPRLRGAPRGAAAGGPAAAVASS